MKNTMMFCYNEPQNLVVTVIQVDGKASPESLHTLLGIHLASRDLHLKTLTNRVFNTMKANTVAWGIDHMQYVGCCKGPKARCFHITYYLHHGTYLLSNSPTQLVDIEICALAYRQKISWGRATALYDRMKRGAYISRTRRSSSTQGADQSNQGAKRPKSL